MVSVRFVEATFWPLFALARTLRDGDAAEVRALGSRPLEALESCARGSEWAAVMLIDDKPAAAFGVAPGNPPTAWCLTGVEVDKHRLTFWRHSRRVVAMLREDYPCLVAHVDAQYSSAVAWLVRLGWQLHPSIPGPGPGRAFFHPAILGGAHAG